DAQYRRGRVVRGRVIVGGFYANPFWYGYSPFYDPWYGFGYQYPYGPYPPLYGYRAYDLGASLRLEVKPKEAEVYVDGYYSGIVDDFDGVFQRLSVEPGEHEIELYLDGFRTVKQKVYVSPRSTFKVKYAMEQLGPGEQPEPRPQPVNPPPQAGGQPPVQQPPMQPRRPPVGRRTPPPPPPADPRNVQAAYGTLSIR